jgi:hypothetical protein
MSAQSGMNVGRWTQQNESWFRKRLAAIRQGSEQPLTASQWASALKGQKKATRLRNRVNEMAKTMVSEAGL